MPGSRLSAGVASSMRVAVASVQASDGVWLRPRESPMPGSRLSAGMASSLRITMPGGRALGGCGFVHESRRASVQASDGYVLRPRESPCLGAGSRRGVASSMRVAVPRFQGERRA